MGATLLWSPCLFGACMQQQSLLKESAVFLTMPHQPLGSSRLQPWVSVPAGWDAGMDEELIGKHLCPTGWEREQRRAGPGHVSEEKSLTWDPGGAQGPTGVRVSSGVLLPEGSGRRRPGQVALLAPAAGPREVDPGPPGCGQWEGLGVRVTPSVVPRWTYLWWHPPRAEGVHSSFGNDTHGGTRETKGSTAPPTWLRGRLSWALAGEPLCF